MSTTPMPPPDASGPTPATRLAGRSLTGERAAVLGGAGAMGLAAAHELAGLGAEVVLLGRTSDSLAAAVAGIESVVPEASASARVVDADDDGALRGALLALAPLHHVVVATSAGVRAGDIAGTPPEAARGAFGRLWTSYAVLHAAPEALERGGSITLLSGSSARVPVAGAGVWTALHGAIEALARGAAVDLTPIRVNVVSPGGIGMAPDRQLVERRGEPGDIGMAVAALVANPAITGVTLDVDSGERRGTWSGDAS